jgi:NAD(P)-dependent dehydrogenase (short-subunit alcohol dehydrogenase family)
MTMNQRGRLDGQVAFVTAGGGGIGRAIALGLAEAGADVAVFEIVPERAEETAARIRELGREALAIPGDAMEAEAIRAAIAATDARFGRLDILVNNAGGVSARAFLEQSERSWRRHIDINLVSMLAATHAAAPLMIRGGQGGRSSTSPRSRRSAPRPTSRSMLRARPGWSALPSRWRSNCPATASGSTASPRITQ